MELVLLVLMGIFWLIKWVIDQYRNIQFARDDAIRNAIYADVGTSFAIKKKLADKELRMQCFDLVDPDMRYILGDDWRSIFDNDHSDYVFQNCIGQPPIACYSQFLPIENIVFYLLLANEGKSPYDFGIHGIGDHGYTVEEAHSIVRRACIVIERILKSRHPDLGNQLDMYICETEGYGFEAKGHKVIRFAFNAESQIKDGRAKRLRE